MIGGGCSLFGGVPPSGRRRVTTAAMADARAARLSAGRRKLEAFRAAKKAKEGRKKAEKAEEDGEGKQAPHTPGGMERARSGTRCSALHIERGSRGEGRGLEASEG